MIKAVYLGRTQESYHLAQTLRALIADSKRRLAVAKSTSRSRLAAQALLAKKRASRIGLRQAQRLNEQRFATLLNALKPELEQIKQNVEKQGLALILTIAEQVIAENIKNSANGLKRRVQKALATIDTKQLLCVLLNPDQASLLQHDQDLCHLHLKVKISADPNLEKGDLALETETGRIEYSWREHLGVIAAALKTGDVADARFSNAA